MFRRKDGEKDETEKKTDETNVIPTIPLRPFSGKAGPAPHIPIRAAVSGTNTTAPITHPAPHIPPAPRKSDPRAPIGTTESRRLFIPSEVALTGDVVKCEKLIVEGAFHGTALSARGLSVGEHGVFEGEASVEEAEIVGTFDGILTVRDKLLIRAGGRVKGTIRYGRLSIENGGILSGDTQPLDEEAKT